MLRYYSYRNRKTIYPIHKQSLQLRQVVSDHQKQRDFLHTEINEKLNEDNVQKSSFVMSYKSI